MASIFKKSRYKQLTDSELLRLTADDNHAAFKVIYNKYWQKLLTLAIYKTNDREDAEEIIQDIFVSVWNRRSELEVGNLEAYLVTAVKMKLIDRLRKKIKEHTKIDIESISISTEIIDYLTVEEFTSQVDLSLKKLSAKTQEVYELSRKQEKSQKEIAELMNLTPKAVEYHITKALKQLKLDLESYLK
ncbi:MAG: RNA polymerase sigma-70 factor (family 1), partial [Oceanospirillaceae bacterium]|jgi:RNA polymerase sigma-70 factor (family 1)